MPLKIADIVKVYRIPERSLYRWQEAHPNLSQRDPNSLLGHPFPAPCGKEGRANVWDEHEVAQWWADNCKTLGRHPMESPIVIMRYEDFRRMTQLPIRYERGDDGTEYRVDDLLMVEEIDLSKVQVNGDVRLKFRSASDAVMFRLKY